MIKDDYKDFSTIYDDFKGGPFGDWSVIKIYLDFFGYKGGRILELGCGTGDTCIWFAQRGYSVVGVDLSASMLEIARKKAKEKNLQIEFINQDISELDLGSQKFMCIFSKETMHHLIEKEKFKKTIQNCFNYLDSDGILVFEMTTMSELKRMCEGGYRNCKDFVWYYSGVYDDSTSIAHLNYLFKFNDGREVKFSISLRSYPTEEIKLLLEEVGFKQIQFFDSHLKGIFSAGRLVKVFFLPVSAETSSMICGAKKL